jgi:spore germination protein
MRDNDRITTIQAAVVVSNALLGSGILTLPRSAAVSIQTPDAWITVLLGGLLAIIAGIVMAALSRAFPGATVFQFNNKLVGKYVGFVISLTFITYFFMTAAYQVRTVTEVTGLFLLEGTPPWAIVMIFMWVSFYLLTGGINAIARLFEIILPITIVIYLLIMLFGLKLFELDNIRPVLGDGIWPVLKGIKTTALSFLGVETILVLTAFMSNHRKSIKAVAWGAAIPMVLYFITVVMVIGSLGLDGVVTRVWPTLDLVRSFEVQGLIFERFESLLLVIWIMQIYSTYTIMYYAASLGLSQLTGISYLKCLFALLPIVFIISAMPQNLTAVFAFGNLLGQSAAYIFGIGSLLLLILCKMTNRRRG